MSAEHNNKELELKKHVAGIHCSNTLSLLQRKISNVLLYHAYDELLEKDEHEITIKTLCHLIGYDSHDYDTLKKALKALISTVLEWNLLEDCKSGEIDDWNASSILASVGIKGSVCRYSYSTRLKKLLYMPEIYGRIDIAVQAKFKSNYALALYENCIRYQNLPYTRWFALATFRKLMGIPEKKYLIFRDFKRRVLDKSVIEVNTFSDIRVEPEMEREGHKVNRIRFKISSFMSSKEACGIGVQAELVQLGLSLNQARKLTEEFTEEFIQEKIALVKKSHTYMHDKVQNITAYLKSALRENYMDQKPRQHDSEPVYNAVQHEIEQKEYADFISNNIDETIVHLNEETFVSLKSDFEQYLKAHNNQFVLEKFYTKDFSNRIVKGMFRVFLKEYFNHLLPTMPTFDEFKKARAKGSL
jgi:plasmid replication initiation protein